MKKSVKKGLFGYSKKGYDVAEVEACILAKDAEIRGLQNQIDKVDGLKSENAKLFNELAEFKSRENEINSTLSVAVEKAKDIKTDVKLQYALEIERLKIFQAKWTNSYEELKGRYRFDKDALSLEGTVTDAELQLERLLNKDFGIKLTPTSDETEKQFIAEAERLEINQEEINKLVEKLKSELKKVS